jgi:hypothetical protein
MAGLIPHGDTRTTADCYAIIFPMQMFMQKYHFAIRRITFRTLFALSFLSASNRQQMSFRGARSAVLFGEARHSFIPKEDPHA